MVTIRLQRRGRRKRPIHHIVVADSRSPRDGRIIEDLGRFDNITQKNEVNLDEERVIHWLKQGAQPSDTVRSILKNQGIMYKMHLMRWDKSEEEIEEALAEWREKRAEKEGATPSRKEKQEAMLEAEEKEYQKQLKKKAEEAAKEKAKQEALAKAEKEEKAKAEEAEEKSEVEAKEEAEEAAEDQDEQAEAKEESDDEETEVEAKEDESEEDDEPEAKADAEDESDDEQEDTSDEEKDEEKAEAADETDEKESSDDEEKAEGQTSDDMLAKEAIEHIENTPLDELDGYVTDDEDRVTVQRAWEEKQEEN